MSDVTFYLFFLSFIYIFVYIYILIVLIYLIKYYTRKIKRWRHKSNWQSWFWCKCQHAFPCGWMWKGHSRDFMRLNVDQRNSTCSVIEHWASDSEGSLSCFANKSTHSHLTYVTGVRTKDFSIIFFFILFPTFSHSNLIYFCYG